MDENLQGRPFAVDHHAQSASPIEPAFISRPEGAPVYHGFVVLDDVNVDGFTLGKITDWEAEPCEAGDAFVIAPDGSRAGLVWEVFNPPYFQEVMAIEADRWGVWGIGFPLPIDQPRERPQESRIYPSPTEISLGGMEVTIQPQGRKNRTIEQPARSASVSMWKGRHRCPTSTEVLAGYSSSPPQVP